MTIHEQVLVAGGYGTIGRMVCETLDAVDGVEVVVAGRTQRKAVAFAETLSAASSRYLDVRDPSAFTAVLRDVDAVVVCFDQNDASFATACLERGIDYVDVSPTDDLLRRIAGHDELARSSGATAVLSVGLSPGLTNLFVARDRQALDTVDRVDISLLLGLGEAFGPDTVKWTVEDAVGEFSVREGGRQRVVHGFRDPRLVELPGWGRRRVYRANLADQHVIARRTDVPTVASRLCYDSRLATAYIAALVRLGIYRQLVDRLGPGRLAALLQRFPFGGEESIVQTETTGTRRGRTVTRTRWIRGLDQARATALVAAIVAERLLDASHPPGVFHVDDRFDLDAFTDRLVDAGYAFGRSEAPN